jgi:hypothetical protein
MKSVLQMLVLWVYRRKQKKPQVTGSLQYRLSLPRWCTRKNKQEELDLAQLLGTGGALGTTLNLSDP